jgi:hypothetical protein
MIRTRVGRFAIATSFALAATIVSAQEAEEANPTAADDKIIVEGEADREICKRTRPPTASRIARSKKICKLASEWEYERQRNAELTDQRYRNVSDQMRRNTAAAMNTANGTNLPH